MLNLTDNRILTDFPRRLCGALAMLLMAVTTANLAAAAEFFPLGFLPGGIYSRADGVSDDGLVVTGSSFENRGGLEGTQAFRWSEATGMEGLGFLPNHNFSLAGNWRGDAAISGDGSTLVGNSVSVPNWETTTAYRYTETEGMQPLTGFAFATSTASAASYDGSVIVGYGNPTDVSDNSAFRWTSDDGLVALAKPAGVTSTYANDTSDDGNVVVGKMRVSTPGDEYWETFIWTPATDMSGLGVRGAVTRASVSSDGMVVASDGYLTSQDSYEAFRWTAATGAVGLGWLPGMEASDGTMRSVSHGINGDGSMIVGFSGDRSFPADDPVKPFLWTEDAGLQDLQQLLIDQYGLGASLAGWNLAWPMDISANGQFIVGAGLNPDGNLEGWLVRLTSPIPESTTGALMLLAFAPLAVWRRRHEQV